jgi:uncharacterized membrane protein
MKLGPWLKAIAVVLVVAGYPALMHWLLTTGHWPAFTLLLVLAPFGLLPLSLLAGGQRLWAAAAAAALLLACAWGWQVLLLRHDLIYLLQNVGMQSLLAVAFGHTLLPGREPLISQFARRIHRNDYSEAIARYTRQATWAWTLYFVVMGLASIVLFVAAPLELWSWFVNFISFLTLGGMFAAEYAVRRWRLRGIDHLSFLQSVKLYWEKPVPADEAPTVPTPP